jgi:uncharacterized protein YjiS (DUF1127 family)
MHAIILRDTTRPARAIEALVAWHGFWPVARALLAHLATFRRPRAAPLTDLDRLPAHLLRDIGLPEGMAAGLWADRGHPRAGR